MHFTIAIVLSFLGAADRIATSAGAGPSAEDRHGACDAASEKWKATCEADCVGDDKSISQIEECKAGCKKDATKLYWNCSTCWTDCGKALERCVEKCPQPAPTPGIQPNESTLSDDPDCGELCQLDEVKCQDTCKAATP